jgi:LacI family transcriptional regulator
MKRFILTALLDVVHYGAQNIGSTAQMTTIKDVAARAEVSVGTVSRVLSSEASVKIALRERVETAIAALGYRPNLTARALRTNQIDVIGLIVPDITNPFFAQLAKSIEAEADRRGNSVMLANSHNDAEAERKHISVLLDRSVRGILIVAASDRGDFDIKTNVPIVSIDRRFSKFPLVSTNHVTGAAFVADHLFELGHRRIAYIAGPQNTEVGRLRRQGFVDRLKALDVAKDPVELQVHSASFDYASGEKVARDILSVKAVRRPTAIAAASDQLAIAALRVARDLKLEVPKDLSIAGFDDISLAELVVPRLTTVRQPTDMLARRAVEIVFEGNAKIKGDTIEGELVIRDSTSVPGN